MTMTQEPASVADMELVREYACSGSNEAFNALASRYVNLVYSVAMRRVGDPHLAEEVTQAVFLVLSRKAGSLGSKTVLSGWLCRAARNVAANALTVQRRRQHREQEAYMQSISHGPDSAAESDAWNQLAPHLDGAMAQLGEKNHDAVVLRFFDGKELKEVGAALGVSEEAAKKRVARAVEKLRRYFQKRGVIIPVSVLVAAISANAVQAAPAGFAPIAAAPMAAGGSTLAILKIMAMTKLKYGILAGVMVAAAVTTTVVILHRPPIKLPPLPNPNGYQYFLQAARELPGDASNYRQMTPAALRTLVEQDAGALALVRQGFEYESRVADNYTTNMMDILAQLKGLNYVFGAEGRLAELDKRPEDAIHSYLDNLRYGQEAGRGGTLLCRLVGVAIEATALRSLAPLTNTADAGQCKEIAGTLENLDAKEPTIAETMQVEQAYMDHNSTGVGDAIARTMMAKTLEAGKQNFVKKEQTNVFNLRLTMISFAARAYELNKKEPPKSVADLTPEYIKAVPQDPRTGTEITNFR